MDETAIILVVAGFAVLFGSATAFTIGWFWQPLTEERRIHGFLLLVVSTCMAFTFFLFSAIIFFLYAVSQDTVRAVDVNVFGIPLSVILAAVISIGVAAYATSICIVGGRWAHMNINHL